MVFVGENCAPADGICARLSRECQRESGCVPVLPKQLKPSATVLSAVNKKATR